MAHVEEMGHHTLSSLGGFYIFHASSSFCRRSGLGPVLTGLAGHLGSSVRLVGI